MDKLYAQTADDFLELSSQQRLQILFQLLKAKSKVTSMAKTLHATKQEVHRNFLRLEDGGLIQKDSDGFYSLTTYGNMVCSQTPSMVFLSQNRPYFQKHVFGDIPTKFIMRVGQLANGTHIKGVTKVLEKWNEIFADSQKFIYAVLTEVPSSAMEHSLQMAKKGIEFNYILSESAILPKSSNTLLKKLKISELIQKGTVDRKMKKNIQTILVMNEKEACIQFPKPDGDYDMTEMIYGTDSMFIEWCLDYYRYCWYGSTKFQENKIGQK